MHVERYQVLWADLDVNGHLRNTAFLDYATESRLRYFARHGYTAADFAAAGFGPVAIHDDIVYRREIRFQEEFTVSVQLAGMSEDGSRMRLRNEFHRADGELAATITSDGVWFDLAKRKRRAPPEAVLKLMQEMPRTEEFAKL